MPDTDLDQLRRSYDELSALHGWSAFRTPRNMALALTGRVGAVATRLQFVGERLRGRRIGAVVEDARAQAPTR